MTRGVGGQSPSSVQKYLKDVEYPTSKEELIMQARRNGAPEDVISDIQTLKDEEFGGPQDVMKAYGRIH